MPKKREDQTKTGILIGEIAVEGGQGLPGEDEAGVLGQPVSYTHLTLPTNSRV